MIKQIGEQLPDDLYATADKWLLKENLPLSYRQQIVEFIIQNTGQRDFTLDPAFRDPYTGGKYLLVVDALWPLWFSDVVESPYMLHFDATNPHCFNISANAYVPGESSNKYGTVFCFSYFWRRKSISF